MNICVAEMQRQHIKEVAKIEKACFTVPWTEQQLAEELGRGIFLVCEQGARVIGYVGCQTVLDEGYITNVAVLPEFRRQGVARRLIEALLQQAQRQALCFVTLEVRQSNAAAITLYRQLGFREVGRRRGFYRNPTEDALLMTRLLREGEKNENIGD